MRLAAVAALMTMPLAPLPAADAAARVVQRDWTQTVTRTPAGAFVIGNPKAKVRLVEYLSMTCGHCAHFSEQAWGPLKADYIGKGLVSLEVRHAIRDGYDLTASLLARCAGPGGYLDATETVLAKQGEWTGQAASLNEEELADQPINERMIAMAKGSGLDALFEGRGMPAPKLAACLSDPAEQKLLAAMAAEAWSKRKIGGTPAFLINGVIQPDVFAWDALEPRLKAALK
jgi:protein-disulfide isomerase